MPKKTFLKKSVEGVIIVSCDPEATDILIRAIRFIKKHDGRAFQKVTKWIKTILVISKNGDLNGVYEQKKTWVAEGDLITKTTSKYIASLLLHEAHHVAQYHAGHRYELPKSEQKAYEVQRAFLQKIGYDEAIDVIDEHFKNQWWTDLTDSSSASSRLDKALARYEAGEFN